MDKFYKYLGNYNLILLITNGTNNKFFLDFINKYPIKEMESYGIKLKKYISRTIDFQIIIFNKSNEIYKTNKYIEPHKLLDKIKNKLDKFNLSLYADYHPKTSKKGLGYKNKQIALDTIDKIKKENLTYQKQVINTLFNRAKYHPNQTNDMKEAMKIFKKWLKEN
jgi:hypothetical protein